ncbi:MAG: XkdF-like putative serine protease domain-containing protein [Chitinophagaceae bacterium]
MAITKKPNKRIVRFTKIDAKKKKVWGVVYSPLAIDSHGDLMTSEEIEKAAHGFLPKDLTIAVDENHNHIPTWSKIIESYIVRAEGDVGDVGAWVVGMQITNDGVWNKILKGELTGYSFEGTGMRRKAEAITAYQRYRIVNLAPAEDGHTHLAFLEYDEGGRVIRGWTNEVNKHKHNILYNTITELSDSHRHRLT